MQNTRTTNTVVDKENLLVHNNFKIQRQGSRRAFGKDVQNVLKASVNMEQLPIGKILKVEKELKPIENFTISNPQLVEAFQTPILEYLKSKQNVYAIDKGYIKNQKGVNNRMRAILVDWLIDVNLKFKMLPQVLFMTVNVIDRYLAIRQVSRAELQLLGVTALMVVGKYEEIYPPLLKDYVSVCDNAYKREDIIRMEESIISALEFKLSQPSSFYFLQLIQQKIKLEPRPLMFVQYILENALLDTDALNFNNLTIVAGATYLVNKIFKRGRWTHEYTLLCGVSEQEAKACAKQLYSIVQEIDSTNLTAVKRKFAAPEYFEISRYRVEKVSGSRNN